MNMAKEKSKKKVKGTSVPPQKKVKFQATRQCLGTDISKAKIDICFMELDAELNTRIKGTKTFSNTNKGWAAILKYINRFRNEGLPFLVAMEATGVYHENFAYYLKGNEIPLSIVLPNMSRNYAKSLNKKSKTDKADAEILAQMGLERKLNLWQGMNDKLLKIKRLLREREGLNHQMTIVKNRRHAVSSSYSPDKETLKRMEKQMAFIQKQIKAIEKQVDTLYQSDEILKSKVEKICKIGGVGVQTVLTVVSEANGFELIKNKGQLVSYSGYDVVENESGTSLRGKTRISKKGNSHIRKALHMPALCAVKHEPKLTELYERVLERNPKTKMIAYVAVQRKLLVLIYTLYKNNMEYNPNFEAEKAESKGVESGLLESVAA